MNQPSLIQVNNDRPGITEITLNNPQKRNALSIAMMQQLLDEIENTRKDATKRVLILKGADPVFCTGMDLREAYDPEKMERSADLISQMLTSIYTLPILTIAAVQGAALAGGAGLMSVCDFAIAAEGTKIGFPEVKRGLVAAIVITFLRRLIPEKNMREIFLFGNMIDTSHALRLGLINHVVPTKDLSAVALRIAQEGLEGAPGAVSDTKRLLVNLHPFSIDEELRAASSFHLKARCSEECREGITAFMEKRDPIWTKK